MTGYRAAIIGCGSIATAHAFGFATAGTIDLVGLADVRRESVDELADRCGLGEDGRFTDYRVMLDQLQPDIVAICLWHGLHAEAVVAASSRGVPLILCEKPMAPTLGDARRMLLAVERDRVKLAIAHQRRFYPGWTDARRLLASGTIGRPRSVQMSVRDGLLNTGIHSIDMARYVLGDPATTSVVGAVHRDTDRHERGIRIEDSAIAVIEVDGGVRIQLESDIAPEGHISANAVIVGTDGLMSIEESHIRVLDGSSNGWETITGSAFGTELDVPINIHPLAAPIYRLVAPFGSAVAQEFVHNFTLQARSLTAWLDGDLEDHPGAARHGYAALEIVMAIYESARMHEVTRMPLRTMSNPLDLMVDSGALPVVRPGYYDIRAGLARGESITST